MKTVIVSLVVGGLSAFGLMTIGPEDMSNFSAIIINTCSPACPQEATCIANECVFPENLGNGETPGGGDPSCTANPDWTNSRGKITICHKTGHFYRPWKSITVSSSSLFSHLAHGDTCGPCGEEPDNNICSPACSQKETCIESVCVSLEDLNCTTNPDWTNSRGKITICHKTGRFYRPWKSITVSSSALSAHITHGDTCGPCEIINPNPSYEDDDDNCKDDDDHDDGHHNEREED